MSFMSIMGGMLRRARMMHYAALILRRESAMSVVIVVLCHIRSQCCNVLKTWFQGYIYLECIRS